MALESEPVIKELSAQSQPPKATAKKDKDKSKASHAAKSKTRASRSQAKATAQKVAEVASSSRKRNISPSSSIQKKARTAITISANRKSLSISPLKRRRLPDPVDSPTDDQIDDPTLDQNGNPARLAQAQDILPDEQSTDFVKDPDYPNRSLMEEKLRSLERDINRTIFGRADFDQFEGEDIITTAKFFWQCGITSTDELKKTRQLNRSFMLEDLRKAGASARDLNLFTGLFRLFPPPAQTQPGKKSNFAECCIPRLLPKFTADISQLNDLLVPDQAMVNDISRQMAEGEMCHPSYLAFPTANLKEEPWKPALATHDRAAEDWKSRMAGLRSSQSISFQAYTLYLLRFIFSAHMVSAWDHFGGISAQLNSLAVLLNLSIVENSGVAIAYDIALRKHCATLARQRRSDIDFRRLLSEECQEVKKQVYSQRSAALPSNPSQEKGKGKKGKKGGDPGAGKGRGKWPYYKKNEYEKPTQRSPRNPKRRSDKKRSRSRSRRSRSRKSTHRSQKEEKKQKKQNSKNGK